MGLDVCVNRMRAHEGARFKMSSVNLYDFIFYILNYGFHNNNNAYVDSMEHLKTLTFVSDFSILTLGFGMAAFFHIYNSTQLV